jgi:hypothetical protein
MASHCTSFEFSQSQQSVEGIGAARSAVDGFIDGEYADGVDDESEGLPESSLLIGCDLPFKW